jgi:electron transport complex protein RnfE
VVNCLILGRQEAFSSKQPLGRAILDALGMGAGFVVVLLVLGSIREILGSGTILSIQLLGDWFSPWLVMILPPGAFLMLGLIIGLTNWISLRSVRS